jgi:NAD+--dinitrogen-reductase ADP-D-ribosyltransferase
MGRFTPAPDATGPGWREHSTNLVGIPTGLIASSVFNEHPLALHIAGARETNPALFEMLEQAADRAQAAEAFDKYMNAVFAIDEAVTPSPRRRYRSSYRRLLEGWGFDANSPAGAVFKGWVESRFGLTPVFHKTAIGRVGSPAWAGYVEEKMHNRYHNNSINAQLDLLYEYCQWSLRRFRRPASRHIRLFRGTGYFSESDIIERPTRKSAVVRLNNLVSFTADRDIADTFGDVIVEVQVPATKVVFFRDLLPTHALTGEAEYLVVGGDYLVSIDHP